MALILNIETSTEVCSVTISRDGEKLFQKESTEGLNHSEYLTVFIEEIFQENNLKMNDLDAVAVSKGPGSYTGLRIGVSVAKGLCYALDIPLIASSTLESMAFYIAQNIHNYYTTRNDESILFCPMIDARRMEVYTSLFSSKGEMIRSIEAEIIDEHSFQKELEEHSIVFFGNGAKKCREKIIHKNALFSGPEKASAQFMQSLSEIKYKKKEFEDVAYFEPFYLKNFVATIPKNKILDQKN